VEILIRQFSSRARIGNYRPSIPLIVQKKLTKVAGPGLQIVNPKEYKLRNLILVTQFRALLEKCQINGGYKKILKFWLWINHNFKYFPENAQHSFNYGGLPNFITSASLVKIEDVKIFPNKYLGNYRQKYTFFLKRHRDRVFDFENLITFNIGGAQTFQHFMQDCFPIIAQTKHFLLRNPDIPILMPEPDTKFKSRDFFLERLGVANKIIGSNSIQSLRVKRLYFWNFLPFNAQYSLPPIFYQTLRSEMTSASTFPKERTLLLFTRREKTRNLKNELAFVEQLKNLACRYKLNFEVLDTSKATQELVVETIKQARIIIGVHGGSMFNTIFCPSDCTIIEIVPTSRTNSTLHYQVFSGLTYIPFPSEFDFHDSNVDVSISSVTNLIIQILDGNEIYKQNNAL